MVNLRNLKIYEVKFILLLKNETGCTGIYETKKRKERSEYNKEIYYTNGVR